MRQKLITLDEEAWKEAEKKTNFSQWVRDMLRSERNKREEYRYTRLSEMSTLRIRHELERRKELNGDE